MAFTIKKWDRCRWQPSGKFETGTYRVIDGQVVKVSDSVSSGNPFDVFVPEGGYVSENLGHRPVQLDTKRQKRALLAKLGLRETNDKLTRREV